MTALIEQTYPSGRVVKNVLENDGDLSMVQSKKNAASGFFNYAKHFTYAASGAVTSMQLGNGRWESTQFNSRLQPTQIALGASVGNSSLLKLDYTYNTPNVADNNGNVLSQTITVNRSNQSPLVFNQTYVYDSLNRLKSAEEVTGTTSNWKQTYTFDRYGNRRFDQANTTFPASFSNPNVMNPTIDPANNRFTTGQNWSYDAAGNITVDPDGRTFTYDGENKQVEVKNSSSASLGTYYFDGDGKRVKKVVPSTGETTVFVYDAAGKLVAEYSTIVAPIETAKVQYLTNDNLGTPRINTDANGAITSRSDYMPYGEEIIALGGRSSTEKYVADDVRQGFTGYINDGETGLDFAEARMYSNTLGRFTGVDPICINAKRLVDPQQLNLFIYVRNNPMMYVDPTGEDLNISGDTDKALEKLRAILGTDDAKTRITYDKDKGLTIDLKDIDLKTNEGAKLLNDLTTSKKVYEFRIADTAITAGGERAVGDMANLSNNDVRLTATTDKPPSGVDGLVVIDPARDGMLSVTEGSGEKLPVPWTTAFHELAESYANVDGSKQYSEAHAGANSREDVLREQRPALKEFMRGGGGPNLRIDGDKLKKHRDTVNKRLKKN